MRFIIAILCFLLSASYSYTLAKGPQSPYEEETILVKNVPIDGTFFTKDTSALQKAENSNNNTKKNVAIIVLTIICILLVIILVILWSAIKGYKPMNF